MYANVHVCEKKVNVITSWVSVRWWGKKIYYTALGEQRNWNNRVEYTTTACSKCFIFESFFFSLCFVPSHMRFSMRFSKLSTFSVVSIWIDCFFVVVIFVLPVFPFRTQDFSCVCACICARMYGRIQHLVRHFALHSVYHFHAIEWKTIFVICDMDQVLHSRHCVILPINWLYHVNLCLPHSQATLYETIEPETKKRIFFFFSFVSFHPLHSSFRVRIIMHASGF